ncbi:MAG: DUF1573 domain-containing protein [Bacteroidetes bacterium]|nr:DUF1573 domain-containing protein [Bacteroidota bacterium]
MKKNIVLLCVACVCSMATFAQPGWGGGKPGQNQLDESEIKAPKITWTTDAKDLGQIPQGVPVTVNFEFTNTGNAPLIISNVKPDCDCTDAKWTKTPVMPGQKGSIEVTFDAKNGGNFSKPATVTSNAKPTESTIVFTGTVVKK